MVGVVGWLTSHDIRQHLQDLMLFLCSKVNHGHSLFGHRILSEQQTKILKHPAKCRRFPKTCRVFFCRVRNQNHTHIQQQKKVKRDKHQDSKLTRLCWNGIRRILSKKTPRNFCDTLHALLEVRAGTLLGSLWKGISNPTVNWIGPTVKSSYDRFVYAPEAEHGNWEYNNIETPAPNWKGKSSAGWTNTAEFDPMILFN